MAQTSTSQSLAATAKYCFLKLSQEQFSPIDSSPTDSYHENMPDQKTEHIFVVHLINSRWNTLVPSIARIYKKLVDLGFVYYDGEVHIVDPELEDGDV